MFFLQVCFIEPLTKDIFDYKSRTCRKQYWLFILSLSLAALLAFITNFLIGQNPYNIGTFTKFLCGFFTLMGAFAAVLAKLAITVRRLRDINYSPWWILLAFIPVAGAVALIILMLKKGFKQKTEFGPPAHIPARGKVHIFTYVAAGLIAALIIWNGLLFFRTLSKAKTPWHEDKKFITALEAASPEDLQKRINFFTRLELKDKDGNTALIYAVRKHPVKQILSVFIKHSANVNAALPNGDTPLFIAIVKSADLDTLQFLIDSGANVNAENEKNITPLMAAAKRGNEKTTALLLLNGAAYANSKGQTVLDWASPQNPVTRAALALAAQADKDMAFKDGVYRDIIAGKDVSDRLLSLPRPAAQKPPSDEELAFAAQKAAALKLLGNIPEAFANADESWAKKMVEKGLTMGKISDGGQTPLMYAVMLAKNSEAAEVFIKAGADINAKDEDGITPLAWAVATNPRADITAMLIDKGADVNAVSKQKISVLGYAAMQTSNPEIIDLLVKSGADINYKGAGGGTPLIYAALYNSEEDIIEALIDNGADVKATDAGGNAVINYAADNKNSKILSVIRKNLLK